LRTNLCVFPQSSAEHWNAGEQAQSLFNTTLEILEFAQSPDGNWLVSQHALDLLVNLVLKSNKTSIKLAVVCGRCSNLNLHVRANEEEAPANSCRCCIVTLKFIIWSYFIDLNFFYRTSNMNVSTSSRMSWLLRTWPPFEASNSKSRKARRFFVPSIQDKQ
jgi:hypothetical protein